MFNYIRRKTRPLIQPLLWKLYSFYARKDRWHTYNGVKVLVKPSVFHPGFLISTHLFIDFMDTQTIKNKAILEMGTGSGLIALSCQKAGAQVVASDINPAAIDSLLVSCKENNLDIKVIQSDLFEAIPQQLFDVIISNPPYFPKTPSNDKEKAFYCGPNFEFFNTFFANARCYLKPSGEIFMILSDDCDLKQIASIAHKFHWEMKEVFKKKKMGEWNMIYRFCVRV